MSDDEMPREPDVQQVSWRLNQSLTTCRAMVANYRLMIGAVANDNQPRGGEDGRGFAAHPAEAEEA